MGGYKIPRSIIPQRGLTKGYEGERVRNLPGLQSESVESREGLLLVDADVPTSTNEAVVEMEGVCVKYGDKEVLGSWDQEVGGQAKKGLSWTIRRGERWGIFGPNGMYLAVHKGSQLGLTVTRIWKNNTSLSDLL